jgi:hypothetical protein
LISSDGITWAKKAANVIVTPATSTTPAVTAPLTANLNSVAYSTGLYGRRFVAVSDAGQVFYCEYSDLTTWAPATVSPATSSPLYAVTLGGLLDYVAVGATGTNLYAD